MKTTTTLTVPARDSYGALITAPCAEALALRDLAGKRLPSSHDEQTIIGIDEQTGVPA